jgi:hypothetical protein
MITLVTSTPDVILLLAAAFWKFYSALVFAAVPDTLEYIRS